MNDSPDPDATVKTDVPARSDSPAPADPALIQALRNFGPGHEVFSRFRLVRELGKGGMGVVWLARDERLGLDIALKFLPGMVTADAEAILDLRKEITRGLALTHPGIVRLYDLHEDGHGFAAIAMEYVPGTTLAAEKLTRPDRCFDVPELANWVWQLLEVLAYMHERARVVHRDLKPTNLMLTTGGELKVADFGIAATLSDSHSRLTSLDTSGTPAYMSPQQATGFRPTAADDIYAVGATLCELLTGKPPFFRGSAASIIHQLRHHDAATIAERRAELGVEGRAPIPHAWENAIACCLAKDPGNRPANIRELAAQLFDSSQQPTEALPGTAPAPAPDDEAATIGAQPEQPSETILEITPEPIAPAAWRLSGRRALLTSLAVLAIIAATAWSLAHFYWPKSGAALTEPPTQPFLRIETGMHNGGISELSLDRRGSLLLTVSRDKTARLWNLAAGGRLLQVLRPPIGGGREGALLAGALSPDGSQAALAGNTGQLWDGTSRIYFFDTASGRLTRSITGLTRGPTELAWSPDGRFLAAGLGGTAENGLHLFEATTGRRCGQDEMYPGAISGLDFSPDGTRLVSSCTDSQLRLYRINLGSPMPANCLELLATGQGPEAAGSVRYSPNGEQLAVGGGGPSPVAIYSSRDLKKLFAPAAEKRARLLRSVAWSADGQTLYAAGRAHLELGELVIRSWDQAGRGAARATVVAAAGIADLRPLPSGGVAFGSIEPAWGVLDAKGVVHAYGKSPNADSRSTVGPLRISSDGAIISFPCGERGQSIARFSLLEHKLAISTTEDPTLRPPRTDGLTRPASPASDSSSESEGRIRTFSVAPDGSFSITSGESFLTCVRADGTNRWTMPINSGATGLNISGDGQVIVAEHLGSRFRWYRASDGRMLLTFYLHADLERWVAWTPEGYYDTSPKGEELIGWHQNQGKDREALFLPAAKYHDKFYRPDIVARALTSPPAGPAPEQP